MAGKYDTLTLTMNNTGTEELKYDKENVCSVGIASPLLILFFQLHPQTKAIVIIVNRETESEIPRTRTKKKDKFQGRCQ